MSPKHKKSRCLFDSGDFCLQLMKTILQIRMRTQFDFYFSGLPDAEQQISIGGIRPIFLSNVAFDLIRNGTRLFHLHQHPGYGNILRTVRHPAYPLPRQPLLPAPPSLYRGLRSIGRVS